MNHNVALVLGGGGAAGNAWTIGIIAGLAEAGVEMGAFALETDSLLDPAAAIQRRALVASRLPHPEWPDRPMIIVAVNAQRRVGCV